MAKQASRVSDVDALERELYLKQIQINRLLEVTQAINTNLAAEALFRIYKDILNWEMSVSRLWLIIRNDESNAEWETAAYSDFEPPLKIDLAENLAQYTRTVNISEPQHPILSKFSVVIPVSHKRYPIAFAFIGGINNTPEIYDRVKFITTITNIIAVAIENKRLFKRQLEQERYKKELELGAQVQSTLIPKDLPIKPQYEFSGLYVPHEGVGGDYYDFIPLSEHQFVFCIADISGKGVGAALLMANFQAHLQSLVRRPYPPNRFIEILNRMVLRITKGDKFITMFIAHYDTRTAKLLYVNAGHNPPLLYTQGQISFLDKGCTILGSFNKLPALEVGEIDITDDALLIAYTDGLSDTLNTPDECRDIEMLSEFTRQHHQLSANDFTQTLHAWLEALRDGDKSVDDLSILTCRLRPPSAVLMQNRREVNVGVEN